MPSPVGRAVNALIASTVASLMALIAVTVVIGPLWWLWALWGCLLVVAVAVAVGAHRLP